jgi:hypothetical protein
MTLSRLRSHFSLSSFSLSYNVIVLSALANTLDAKLLDFKKAFNFHFQVFFVFVTQQETFTATKIMNW